MWEKVEGEGREKVLYWGEVWGKVGAVGMEKVQGEGWENERG
jgi:hypothetical protein